MKFFEKNIFLMVFIVQFLYCCSAIAITKVYVIDNGLTYGLGSQLECCIAADSNDWECNVYSKSIVSGESKRYPISFHFTIAGFIAPNAQRFLGLNAKDVMIFAIDYLHKQAKLTSSVFSSIYIREESKMYYVVDCVYFNNNYAGGASLYIQPIAGTHLCYTMFVKTKEAYLQSSIDEETRINLFKETFSLITPLCALKSS